MQDFKARLRNETKNFHDALEKQYPFKELVTSTCDEQALLESIYCFKLIFAGHISQNKKRHQFLIP